MTLQSLLEELVRPWAYEHEIPLTDDQQIAVRADAEGVGSVSLWIRAADTEVWQGGEEHEDLVIVVSRDEARLIRDALDSAIAAETPT